MHSVNPLIAMEGGRAGDVSVRSLRSLAPSHGYYIHTIPFLRSPLAYATATLTFAHCFVPLSSPHSSLVPFPIPIPCTLANATTISIGAEKGLGTACCADNHPFLQVLRGGDAGKQPSGGRARRSDRRPRPRPSSSSDGRNKRQVPGIGSGPWWEGRTSVLCSASCI